MWDNNLVSVRPAVRPSKWPTYRRFCLLKFTKYLKILSVRMDISNTNEYLFSILYTCIYNHTLVNSVKFCPDQIQNGRLNRHFCLLKLTKYLKILSVWMDISNTNEYLFSILYTCIYYYTLMNSVKFCPDQIQNG